MDIPNASGIDGNTWGPYVYNSIMSRYNTEQKKAQTAAETFSLSCAGSTHPASHRFSTHWTGDIFNTALMDSVAITIKGGYESYTPYVHPDCTGHHGGDDDEIYLRWIQFCSMSNLIRVHSDPWNDRRQVRTRDP